MSQETGRRGTPLRPCPPPLRGKEGTRNSGRRGTPFPSVSPRPGTPYGRARPLAQMRTASATADACASSFTYRNGAPRRPASANDVGAQRAFSHGTASKVGSKGIACIRHSVFAHQPCRQPGAVGWMFPVGKGGARSSGRGTRTETSAPLTSATTTAGTPSGSRKSPATKASAPMLANKTYFTWSKP
jgi:hypothetical protein